MVEERAYWLAWSQIRGIGAVLLQRLQAHYKTLAAAWQASPASLAQIDGFGGKLLAAVTAERSRLEPEKLLADYCDRGFQFWTLADDDYPRLLREIPSPPGVLYYRGQVKPAELQGFAPLIGIVGTRNATEYGRRWTGRLSTALSKHGFGIISGLALGIDTEAHQACLEAGGRTLAVLGTGIDIIYPSRNAGLFERIEAEGLLLSDYPPGTRPDAKNFPPRNRIIAGLSRAVLVMEAQQRSGALITAHFANEFGRDIFALPGSLDQPYSWGCLELCTRGAQPILGESELIEALGEIPQLDAIAPAHPETPADLAPELAQILETLASESLPLDLIVQNTGTSAGQVSGALLQLELMGLVRQLPGLRYQRC
ncbi:MAG: DNA-protecting protein DprA [Spirulinaceae cyanobacterium SM2_1_0]|nr:DNA-protecting protein DprA [Spirulinaceae cyanobacterium SM2_1_0]